MTASPPLSDDPIDRLSATRRPDDVCVMYQRWASLLFLHWEVPPEALRALLPRGLELDTYHGQAFVGLVAFTMIGIRPRFLPAIRWLSDFHEVNVRTYVHRDGRDPGVYFFSLDAAQPVAVRLARSLFRLPYRLARMSLNGQANRGGESRDLAGGPILYDSERVRPGPLPAGCQIRYRPTGTPGAATLGTRDHFLAERYLLYTESGGRLYRGQVHHTAYPLQSAQVESLEESLVAAAGIARPNVAPLAHFAREVQVEVFPLHLVQV